MKPLRTSDRARPRGRAGSAVDHELEQPLRRVEVAEGTLADIAELHAFRQLVRDEARRD